MLRKVLFVLVVALCCGAYSIQNFKENYVLITNYRATPEFIKAIADNFDTMRLAGTYSNKDQKKDIKEILTANKKAFVSLDTSKLLMRTDTITKYLQALTDRIQQKNPLLKGKKITLFTYRTEEPNAANWGAGVILVNLDLLSKYTNEEEICITLCHEISHDLKNHVIHGLEEKYAVLNSEAFKKEVKTIKQTEFGKYKQIEALLAKFLSKNTKSSRTKELEADSLGLVLYCNAGYSAYYAFQEMEKLDSIDKPIFFNKIDYSKQFNSPIYPFKKSWLEPEGEEETITGSNVTRERPDSLKTHPDCKIRLQALKRIAKRMNYNTNKPAQSSTAYNYFKTVSLFEELEYNQSEYNVGDAIYQALQLNTLYPNNAYVKCSIVNSLYEFYNSKIDHYMSLVVDYPKNTNPPEYNQMLIFLNNLNLDAVKNILTNYYDTNVKNKINDAYGAYVAALVSSINMTKKDKENLIVEYKKKYNDPHYIKLLTIKFKPKK
ncbi:MAG TPA: M48 family metalloprotease [Bacteroidia bacterium]|nr:M48 family metalloprotease [Bacteroidia bacterium]